MISVNIYIHDIYMYICMYIYIHMICKYTCNVHIYDIYIYTYDMYIYMYTYMIYLYLHIYDIYIHIYIHIDTYIYIWYKEMWHPLYYYVNQMINVWMDVPAESTQEVVSFVVSETECSEYSLDTWHTTWANSKGPSSLLWLCVWFSFSKEPISASKPDYPWKCSCSASSSSSSCSSTSLASRIKTSK